MYGMDSELYRNRIMDFIKCLDKWRKYTGDYEREPLISYRYPITMVSVYIHTDKMYYYINMYKQTHKSKWISKYCDLVMGIKETEIPRVYKRIRICNNIMAKLIKRKRGMIR
mgnify:CR=1 FL=1